MNIKKIIWGFEGAGAGAGAASEVKKPAKYRIVKTEIEGRKPYFTIEERIGNWWSYMNFVTRMQRNNVFETHKQASDFLTEYTKPEPERVRTVVEERSE